MKIGQRIRNGLTAYQIKIIALIFMTIDHLGAYAFEIPVIGAHVSLLRLLGRIAAPLFLYMLTESVRYTHSRMKLLLRLYISAVATGILNILMNSFFGNILGIHTLYNIFFTYFYTVLYIVLIDEWIKAIQNKNWKRSLIFLLGMLSTYLLHILRQYFFGLSEIGHAGKEWFNCFIESPLLITYSPLFILLGILMYFSKRKWVSVTVFLAFCFISWCPPIAIQLRDTCLLDFFDRLQYMMVLAAPIMLLYNGKRGNHQHKLLFYLYYPIHRYIIIILEALLT